MERIIVEDVEVDAIKFTGSDRNLKEILNYFKLSWVNCHNEVKLRDGKFYKFSWFHWHKALSPMERRIYVHDLKENMRRTYTPYHQLIFQKENMYFIKAPFVFRLVHKVNGRFVTNKLSREPRPIK